LSVIKVDLEAISPQPTLSPPSTYPQPTFIPPSCHPHPFSYDKPKVEKWWKVGKLDNLFKIISYLPAFSAIFSTFSHFQPFSAVALF
jgi:hypothetical protein